MLPFDSLIYGKIHNKQVYSKGEIVNTDKLPRLYEENDSELADIESQYSELIKPTPRPKRRDPPTHDEMNGPKLSTDAVIRLGGERFIQSFSSSTKDVSTLSHPYGTSFSGLSDQQVQDVQLIENLLLCAEKVSQQQFERSIKLLEWCDVLSSNSGNPIQRLVYYFSKTLREKVEGENGRILTRGSGKSHVEDIEGRIMTPNPATLAVYQNLPFFQAATFSGVQALVDGVIGSKKVHIIDLSIRQGLQSTILMQALASQPNCPIEHLKITAIGTRFKQKIEQTGDRLKSFAESINLSFSFNAVVVKDMLEFNKDLLELDQDEALGVYSCNGLWTMIAQQDRLECLMNVIKSTNPRVMVVGETAANLNSPNFVNRFIEALFFYGAFFDSLEDCMGREDENRALVESVYLGQGIRSIVGTEGVERAFRHVNIDVWRKFFARFGMEEVELSMSALYQANLMVEKLCNGGSCTLDMDGNSLVIGWKGTPIQCLSAWKFE
ncbi:DELLA protein GAI1-like isoform X2 [Rutidosis leptorrhynchoides]|uniref:DELLA protein GAI1-like isoform X2 n=1 Tax=Rutidosis leptorrhynchoides TaxID=125765 RepID=UPI003A98FDDA